jgi:hypothetical protein
MAMSEVWNKVHKSDSSFFGEEPSNFALLCFSHIGHGRDTIFYASNGIEVDALDYSPIAVGILDKIAKEKRLPIKTRLL